jgi:tetratricopeptide (TPR) repeat protein
LKTQKRELSDAEKVISTVSSLKEQLQEKQKNLIYAIAAFVAVILLVVGSFTYINSNKIRAAEYEADGYGYFYRAQGDNASAMYMKALESFKKAYYTQKRAYTLFYIANCYEKLGKSDEALKTLNDLVNNFNDTVTLSLTYNKMAALHINRGEPQKALEAFDKLKKTKGAPLQDLAIMQSAVILESMGKNEEAKAQYKELVERFPNSPFAPLVRAKTADAQGEK